jgi:hypothetical protein
MTHELHCPRCGESIPEMFQDVTERKRIGETVWIGTQRSGVTSPAHEVSIRFTCRCGAATTCEWCDEDVEARGRVRGLDEGKGS